MTLPVSLAALVLLPSPALAGKKKDAAAPAATTEAAAPAAEAAPAAAVPEAAQHAYDYRELVFQGLGNHMRSLSTFVKGKLDPRTDDLVAHSKAMHELSRLVPHVFPEGTGPDVIPSTEALSNIWTDPSGFAEKAQALQTETAALVDLASGDDFDAFKAQFGKVGGTCGACHDGYRKDED